MSELLADLRDRLGATYRIDRELGGGGMSRVFVAEELALGRQVVLKVLPPELGHVLSAARFEREVRVAARLQHPHIVPLLAAGGAGEMLYYSMPLVEGESLRTRLDRQRELPVPEAITLLREIADALAYAHNAGVVHRDIKPDNILLSHRHAMVTDFGVARAVSEAISGGTLTQTGMAVGTPAYMAPEQASGDAHIDHRADLYALGVVAYEMLAGEPPFRGSMQSLVAAHLTQAPPPLGLARPSVPAELAAIVHRCLEKRAADRFQDAGEITAALEQVVVTRSGDRLQAQPTPSISRRTLVAGGVAAGLMAGVGGGFFLAGGRRSVASPTFQRLTFRRGLIRTARFVPDGSTVLYGACWDGDVCRVHSVRPDSPESAPLSLPPATPLSVSSTGELALGLGTHLRGIYTYGTLARVPLAGGAPRELLERVRYADWTPDGTELAIVRGMDDHDRLELPLGTVLMEPSAPNGGFSFVRVSPRGDAVAAFELVNPQDLIGRVVIIDRASGTRTTSDQFFNVFGLAWRGDEVWFTAADTLPLFRNTIYALKRSGDFRIVARLPGNASLHDIAADGRLLIARTDDRSGMAVRAPGDTAERDLSWFDGSAIADISRDGTMILFSEFGVGGGPHRSTFIRPTDGGTAVRLADGMAHALSPDARWALTRVDDAPHFNVVPTGAGEAHRLERRGLTMLAARWLKDGRVVVLAREGSNAPLLFLVDIAGEVTQAITPSGFSMTGATWALSPGGDAVAVSTGERLTIFPLDGGATRQAAGNVDRMRVVGWIERGLLLSEEPTAGGVVYSVDPASGRREVWADITPRDPGGIMNLDLASLVVTPDGRGYGYRWHRAISDLLLADGLG